MKQEATLSIRCGSSQEQEQQVIKLRYGLDDGVCRTLLECSQILGITKQQCAQIEKSALKKLRVKLAKYITQ
jgi:RNA polymerase sporulation-specific sigma factor